MVFYKMISKYIPSTQLLTEALLNFDLIELDSEFHERKLSSISSVHEAIITFRDHDNECLFSSYLITLFDQFEWKNAGDKPIHCCGGHIMVKEDGKIEYRKKKLVNMMTNKKMISTLSRLVSYSQKSSLIPIASPIAS